MRVHLVSWDPVDARAHLRALATLGHTATWLDGTTGTPLMRALRASGADLFLIDLGRRPSHGREVAMALRSSPATRQRPLVFAGGDDVATARMRDLLPDATYTTWGRLKTALPKALTSAPAVPVVPPDRLFSGRTLAQKLGIAAGETVAILGAPPGFADLLGALPAGTRLTARADRSSDRLIWFVRSGKELQTGLGRLAALVTTQVAWLAWPKAASGVKSGVTGNDVRESGLAVGLVDFKICSIDPTWSGLAFKRRAR